MVTGDSQEEVIIFRDRQTDRHTLHHNIYIIIMIMIDIQPVKKGEVRGKKSAAEVGVKGATPAWWTNMTSVVLISLRSLYSSLYALGLC